MSRTQPSECRTRKGEFKAKARQAGGYGQSASTRPPRVVKRETVLLSSKSWGECRRHGGAFFAGAGAYQTKWAEEPSGLEASAEL